MAKILIVDDESGIRELLSEILSDNGHDVTLAENAAQARAARLLSKPDLVLLDIWMPDMDGITLLKEWALKKLLGMPVILMTGHASIERALAAKKYGATSHLEKPVSLKNLLLKVNTVLNYSHIDSSHPCYSYNQKIPTTRGHPPLPKGRGFHFNTGSVCTSPPPTGPGLMQSAARPPPEGGGFAYGALDQKDNLINHALPPPLLDNYRTIDAAQGVKSFHMDKIFSASIKEFEFAYFHFHLKNENGNITQVAKISGLDRTSLYRKLKKLNIIGSKGARLMI